MSKISRIATSLFVCLAIVSSFAATAIFRSVGPENTGDLIAGQGLTVTISGATATFSSDLPPKVGVGDVLEYQASSANKLAFIHARTSGSVYTVKDFEGEDPAAAAAGTAVKVFRAYSSIHNALLGVENTSLSDDVEDFDTWTGGKDLTASDEQWNLACYKDGISTQPISIHDTLNSGDADNWVSDNTRYMKIFTPHLSSEVGVSQRHTGKAGTGYVVRPDEVTDHIFYLRLDYTIVDGLELDGNNGLDSASAEALRIQSDSCVIRNMLVHGMKNQRGDGILMYDASFTVTVENCIIYDCRRSGIAVQPWRTTKQTQNWVIRNCTIFRCGFLPYSTAAVSSSNCGAAYSYDPGTGVFSNDPCGHWTAAGISIFANGTAGAKDIVNVHIENTIVVGTVNWPDIRNNSTHAVVTVTGGNNISSDNSVATFAPTSSHANVTPTANTAPGAGNFVIFKDTASASTDLHIVNNASNKAIGAGANLSDHFTNDVDGQARPAKPTLWDIGADQAALGTDATNPTVTSVPSPAAGAIWWVDTTYTIQWSASDNFGVDSIKLYYKFGSDSTLITTLAGDVTSHSWVVATGGAVGTATIVVEAIDAAGNKGAAASSEFEIKVFIVDNTDPVVSVTAPTATDAWVIGTSNNITWTASDNIGIKRIGIYYQIGTGAWLPIEEQLAGDLTTYAWDVQVGRNPGAAKIKVTATDTAGNVGIGESPQFTIKPQAPAVGVIYEPRDKQKLPLGGAVTIKWDNENIFVDGRTVKFRDNQGDWEELVSNHNTDHFEWSPLPTTQGTYFIKVIVYNSDGVAAETPERQIFIEKKPHFTSKTASEAYVGVPWTYDITFDEEGFGTPVITLLKQTGTWVNLIGSNKLMGTPPPPAPLLDTVWVQLKAGPGVDTLVLVIKGSVSIKPVAEGVLPSTFNVRPLQQSGQVDFFVSLDRESALFVNLYDIQGRKVWGHYTPNAQRGIYRVGMDKTRLRSGTYLMRAGREGKQITKRIVLMR